MLFNSFFFLGFFALVAVLHYAAPMRWRWVLLLVASYYFYGSFDPRFTLLLVYATVVAYLFGRLLEGRKGTRQGKVLLAFGIVASLAVLVLFKYADFLLSSAESVLAPISEAAEPFTLPRLEWILPAGLSFFTFSCVSYLVDCYRGTIPAERHLGRLAVYVAFFPKLIAGPIERASTFLPQLERGTRFEPELVTFGLQLLLWGLFKKVVIADRLAEFVDAGFSNPDFQSPITLLIAVYFYAFQIYCDFSGYSDMATGLSAILGYRLMENFRRPYLSRSVPEFWAQRWHISLAAWFRDYLYIPLGGNRVSKQRWYFNQMAVFAVSGLWHGANWTFVVWGALNGLYQVLYYVLGAPRKALGATLPSWLWNTMGVLLTFHLILISWVFFRAESITAAWKVLTRIFSSLPLLPMLVGSYNWSVSFWIAVVLIALLLLIECLDEMRSMWVRLAGQPTPVRWGVYYALLGCLIVIGQWGMTEFVYMQF